MKTNNSLSAMKTPLLDELKAIAPSVVFSVRKEQDESFRWDGDGPDPAERGIYPHDITVTAKTIVRGEFVEGTAHLGGSYYEPDEPCGDVHGYLPQMLEEAIEELSANGKLDYSTRTSLDTALAHIKTESRKAYDAQQSGH